MSQSDKYKYIERTDYLANLVGADVAEDILNTVIKRVEDDIDISDRADRDLGKVDVGAADVTLPVEQQTPVGVENTSGTAIDPATEATLTALAGALAANATDLLRVDAPNPLDVSASPVSVDSNTALDVSAATVTVSEAAPIDIADRDARNLGDVDVTALPDSDESTATGTALDAGTSLAVATLSAPGAERLLGQVKSTGQGDLNIEWLDGPGGAVVRTEEIANTITGGDWTNIDVPARSPYCNVVITDTSGAAQTVDHTAHMT